MTDNAEKANTKTIRESVDELLDGASQERLQAAFTLFSLSEEKAVIYGDALSLLIDSDYNIATIKQAVSKVKDEQGLQIVRTRTSVRVFKYPKDEDNLEAGFTYRGFYVNTVTPEQKIAIGVGRAEKLKEMLGTSFVGEDMANNPAKLLEFINSDAFTSLMTEPNKMMRQIVIENMQEVEVRSDGKPVIPLFLQDEAWPPEEFVLQALEEDLTMLIEQQGIMAKNLPMTGI